MTPKEKARELRDKMYLKIPAVYDTTGLPHYPIAKEMALIAIDEIIRLSERSDLFLMKTKQQLLTGFQPTEEYMEYWSDVKKELKKL